MIQKTPETLDFWGFKNSYATAFLAFFYGFMRVRRIFVYNLYITNSFFLILIVTVSLIIIYRALYIFGSVYL